jgi:hypothetical protein
LNQQFVVADSSFDSSYMFTVNASSYQPNVYVVFRNCIIDVRGNFLMSTVPVNFVFDGCTFRVANTRNLLTIDYSNGTRYGCTGNDTDGGDIEIKNSVFTDTGSQTPVGTLPSVVKSLFNVKSLFDFRFTNVTF